MYWKGDATLLEKLKLGGAVSGDPASGMIPTSINFPLVAGLHLAACDGSQAS